MQSRQRPLPTRDGRPPKSTPPRSALLAVLVLLLAGTIQLFAAPSAAAASTVGGPISRTEIIQRAQYWYEKSNGNPGFVRDLSLYPIDPAGKGYRSDCSGLVSMAWHLSTSLSTGTLPTVATRIDVSQLQPGDILLAQKDGNHSTGHVAIFHKWANTARTTYWGYDHGGGRLKYQVYGLQRAGDSRTYVPYRYTKVTGGGGDLYDPIGYLDGVTKPSPRAASVYGWSADPDTPTKSIPVHLYLTGPGGRSGPYVVLANASRPDVAGAYPGYGALHGFGKTFTGLAPGSYKAEAFGIDSSGAANDYRALGVKYFTVS